MSPYPYGIDNFWALNFYGVIVDEFEDEYVVNIIKNRWGPNTVDRMSKKEIINLKDKSDYRIEKYLDIKSLDFNKLIGVTDLYSHKIDGFYLTEPDIKLINRIIKEL